ncbi:MAG TPA: putative oxidoreductase C-terminal domain-containing protein [bacterium]|nr:putative oxidoreductase C-terminal domain-containing protein [bacterium]HPN43390.1 putative oxidoreductase C-terminal domain-containing protein [bacterium]
MKFTCAKAEVKIINLDPGHFHAALVQKTMYEQISPVVYVYAPDGPEVEDYLSRINDYNTRSENPTAWDLRVYKGNDYLEKMLAEKPGNVLVTAGNNRKKMDYVKTAIAAGINVLADKPLCINKDDLEKLLKVMATADSNHTLLYDIMTERFEITTILQRELMQIPAIFGTLQTGTPEEPAVTKESVHHFFKYVSGNPLKRPAWFMDVTQQGEGIVDVTTHLVDLIQWECFPEQIINYKTDIELVGAKRWPTIMTPAQFSTATQLPSYPDYLQKYVDNGGNLQIYANGEINYKIKNIHARVSVLWNFQAPEGAGDTHYSIMRGSQANVTIRQGKEQNYVPELYIEASPAGNINNLAVALETEFPGLQAKYPGIGLEKSGSSWHVVIPKTYRTGHEAHFGQVTEKFLQYLMDGKMPDWEAPNMLAKYYTTTTALEIALQNK